MLCRGHVSSMRTALNMNDAEYELMDDNAFLLRKDGLMPVVYGR